MTDPAAAYPCRADRRARAADAYEMARALGIGVRPPRFADLMAALDAVLETQHVPPPTASRPMPATALRMPRRLGWEELR